MDPASAPRHPVLSYLAIIRAARDFGLHPDELAPLAARFPPAADAVDELAGALTAALLRD